MYNPLFGGQYEMQEAVRDQMHTTAAVLKESTHATVSTFNAAASLMLAPFVAMSKIGAALSVPNPVEGIECLAKNNIKIVENSLRMTEALLAEVEAEVRQHGKPAWGVAETKIGEKTFAVRDVVAHEKPFCNVVHFECEGAPERPSLLLFAPLSGHHATLLRDTVRGLLPHFDVSVTDWKDAKIVPLSKGGFGLGDYISYAKDFIGEVKPDTVMAVCQPGPALAAALTLREQQGLKNPRSAIIMGSPIDVDAAPTEVTRFADKHSLDWFKENVIQRVSGKHPGKGREVYPGLSQYSAFVLMNLETHQKKLLENAENAALGKNPEAVKAHDEFYKEYRSTLDLSGRFYLETLKYVFGVSEAGKRDRSLVQGNFMHEGEKVDWKNLTKTAVLVVEGEKDDICAIGQTKALHKMCVNLPEDKKDYLIVPGAGHYGIFNGSKWRETVVPKIVEFYNAQNAPHPQAQAAIVRAMRSSRRHAQVLNRQNKAG